jgi:hypothetical protein
VAPLYHRLDGKRVEMSRGIRTRRLPREAAFALVQEETRWQRNKKVAIKHGFEGVRERTLPWH